MGPVRCPAPHPSRPSPAGLPPASHPIGSCSTSSSRSWCSAVATGASPITPARPPPRGVARPPTDSDHGPAGHDRPPPSAPCGEQGWRGGSTRPWPGCRRSWAAPPANPWTSAGPPGSSSPPNAPPWPCGMGVVCSRTAPDPWPGVRPIIWCPGWRAAPPTCPTWRCCAGPIIGRCTRAAGGWSADPTASSPRPRRIDDPGPRPDHGAGRRVRATMPGDCMGPEQPRPPCQASTWARTAIPNTPTHRPSSPRRSPPRRNNSRPRTSLPPLRQVSLSARSTRRRGPARSR